MPTRVKICGITRLVDARLAIELGAAALGFNFYPRSPRYLEPRAAADIVERLPPFVTAVGVFAGENDAAHVATVAREAGITVVQLHGPEEPVPAKALEGFLVIRAVPVGDDFKAARLARLKAQAFLLDADDPEKVGGTGRTFNWALAREASRYGPIILAGGLTPENVGEAIRQVRPFAVDVASGVEAVPRAKDAAKLRAFFAAVEGADRELGI